MCINLCSSPGIRQYQYKIRINKKSQEKKKDITNIIILLTVATEWHRKTLKAVVSVVKWYRVATNFTYVPVQYSCTYLQCRLILHTL